MKYHFSFKFLVNIANLSSLLHISLSLCAFIFLLNFPIVNPSLKNYLLILCFSKTAIKYLRSGFIDLVLAILSDS